MSQPDQPPTLVQPTEYYPPPPQAYPPPQTGLAYPQQSYYVQQPLAYPSPQPAPEQPAPGYPPPPQTTSWSKPTFPVKPQPQRQVNNGQSSTAPTYHSKTQPMCQAKNCISTANHGEKYCIAHRVDILDAVEIVGSLIPDPIITTPGGSNDDGCCDSGCCECDCDCGEICSCIFCCCVDDK